jgi:formylglycine-generating enzyme required for sulfatase activity
MPLPDSLQLVGTTLVGKYDVESVVGEGGFAIVYRAQHKLWKRTVAVKVFKALGDVAPDQRSKLLEAFIQEGALLADLSERSAAICQARDVGMLTTPRGEEVPYMVLEWLEGASLEGVIQAEKDAGLAPRTIEETVRLLEPAAEALALAHVRGIAHRDVKPANVFVLGDARADTSTVKLLDFGIAKVVQDVQKMSGAFSKTAGQVTSFTPAYGAPEQFSRSVGATGPWTDVFALALVIVELLTQRDPLDGDDFMVLAFSATNPGTRPTPRTRGAVVTDAVEAVVARALAVKPGERYATAGEFWNALRAALRMPPMRSVTGSMVAATELAPHAALSVAPTVAIEGNSPGAGAAAAAPDASAAFAASGVPAASGALALRGVTGTGGKRPATRPIAFVAAGGAIVVAGVLAFTLGRGRSATVGTSASPSASAVGAPLASTTATTGAASTMCPDGMIYIPGGEFFMGSDEDVDLAKPAHHVRLSPYCIDTFEVTVARYKACSDRGACKRASLVNEWGGITEGDRKTYDPLCNARMADARAKHPINCVDWEQATLFCRAEGARLPTEAEWEFAARGSDGRRFPWGDDAPTAAHLNACGTECVAWGKAHKVPLEAMYPTDDGYANTAPVGSFPAGKSRFGVEDVVGNVWEWVADYYAPYARAPEGEMPRDPAGPKSGSERVIRGGAWNGSEAAWVRPTYRFHDTPSKRAYGIGFRCAR